MSKIGEKIINLTEETKVEIQHKTLKITGKEGEMQLEILKGLNVELGDNTLSVKRKRNDKRTKAMHGLFRSLIANAVQGVEKPWEKSLEVVGTGYNVKMKGEDLEFKVGYSHPVVFKAVPGIKYKVEDNNKIVVSGVDKQLVGQVSFQIKKIKPPDVYKGKGIKFEGERLRIKPGKKAKTITTGAAAA